MPSLRLWACQQHGSFQVHWGPRVGLGGRFWGGSDEAPESLHAFPPGQLLELFLSLSPSKLPLAGRTGRGTSSLQRSVGGGGRVPSRRVLGLPSFHARPSWGHFREVSREAFSEVQAFRFWQDPGAEGEGGALVGQFHDRCGQGPLFLAAASPVAVEKVTGKLESWHLSFPCLCSFQAGDGPCRRDREQRVRTGVNAP